MSRGRRPGRLEIFARLSSRRTRADIDQASATERALVENSERYRSLFAYNPHAAFSLDLEGRFIDTNAVAVRAERLHAGRAPEHGLRRRGQRGGPPPGRVGLRERREPASAAARGARGAQGRSRDRPQHHRDAGCRRRRGGGSPRDRGGHHRAQRAAARAGTHPAGGGGGERGQVPLPGEHQPRGAYAADQPARRDRAAPRDRDGHPAGQVRGDDRPVRETAAAPGQRHPRLLQDRGGQGRAAGGRSQPAGRRTGSGRVVRSAGGTEGPGVHLERRPRAAGEPVR